jgi:hypothetical protein
MLLPRHDAPSGVNLATACWASFNVAANMK